MQLISPPATCCTASTIILLFAIPLVVGARFGVRAGGWLKLAGVSGIAVTLLSMVFNLMPIVDSRQHVALWS